MLKLGAQNDGWETILPAVGVRVRFLPITIKAVRAARRAVAMALTENEEDIEEAGDALSRELLRRGIAEWEGVCDLSGTALPVTAESIELFLADPTAYEAADRAYVRPWADREREKNGFAGSPNGTGAAETPAKDTASSPARPRRVSAARRARTAKTSSKQTKAKPSGR